LGRAEYQDLTEVCLKQKRIYQGKVFRVEQDEVRLPNGLTGSREVVRHPGAVGILALKEEKILLVRQYRYALGRETLEIPAGKLDWGEEPEVCAIRELREETGYQGKVEKLGEIATSPGFTDEIIHLYRAADLVWAPLTTDDDEFINVESVPLAEAAEQARRGEITDAKTALAILLGLNDFAKRL